MRGGAQVFHSGGPQLTGPVVDEERLNDLKTKWADTRDNIPDSAPWKAPLILVAQALGWED